MVLRVGADAQALMRTYYRGPDAVVTEASLTVGRPPGRSFTLSDLDAGQLSIVSESSGFNALYIWSMYTVTSLLGCLSSTIGITWKNWWVGLGGTALAVMIFVATYVPVLFRNDDIYVLMGVYRGVETRLYTSSSEAKAFRIQYAVRQALEDGPSTGAG